MRKSYVEVYELLKWIPESIRKPSLELRIPQEDEEIFLGFEGDFLVYNAPMRLVSEFMVSSLVKSFKGEKLKRVESLIFEIEGKGEEFEELLNHYRRVFTEVAREAPRVLERILEITELRKLKVKKDDEQRLANISFFLGTKQAEPYCILYIWNVPFLESRMPQYAIVIKDRELIRRLDEIGRRDWVNPEAERIPLEDLLNQPRQSDSNEEG